MDSQGEIFRLCRLCLVKDQVDIPIFDDPGDERQILLKISSCLPVTVSQDDDLPKKICDVCSEKLDSFYEFWNSTASAEKTLRDRLAQEVRQSEPMVPKPIKTLIKEESEVLDEAHAEPVAEEESTKDETEAPPRKRPRRVSAIKAQVSIAAQESDDEEFDTAELVTKVEDGSDEMDIEEKVPNLLELPGTSTDIDQDQAGPSGLGKDGAEAPFNALLHQHPSQYFDGYKFPSTDLIAQNPNHQQEGDMLSQWNPIVVEPEEETSQYAYKCLTCNLSFYSLRYLKSHVHQDGCSYFCECCCQKFISKENIIIHALKHNMGHVAPLVYKCNKCFIEFDNQQVLSKHRITCGQVKTDCSESSFVKLAPSRYVNCEDIPVVQESVALEFNALDLQATGSITNIRDANVTYQESRFLNKEVASTCSVVFNNKKDYPWRVSEGQTPFFCVVCDKSFTHVSDLDCHFKIHTAEKHHSWYDRKTCKCNKCCMEFDNRRVLKDHQVSCGQVITTPGNTMNSIFVNLAVVNASDLARYTFQNIALQILELIELA